MVELLHVSLLQSLAGYFVLASKVNFKNCTFNYFEIEKVGTLSVVGRNSLTLQNVFREYFILDKFLKRRKVCLPLRKYQKQQELCKLFGENLRVLFG